MKKLIIFCVSTLLYTLTSCNFHYSIVKVEMHGNWTSRDSVWVIRSMPKDEYKRQKEKYTVYENSSNWRYPR